MTDESMLVLVFYNNNTESTVGSNVNAGVLFSTIHFQFALPPVQQRRPKRWLHT